MKFTWATRITILRILLIIPFVIFMLKINDPALSLFWRAAARYAAITVFLVMAASDALDGFLARRNGQSTKLGAFLDPTADKLLITCACLLLSSGRAGVEGFQLPTTVVVIIIGKDLFLLIGFTIIYLITSRAVITPIFIGKVATVLQLSMVAGILVAPEVSRIVPGWIWLLRVLWWSAATTAVLTTLVYIRQGSRLLEDFEHRSDEQS